MRRNRQLFRARLEGSRMRATLVIVCGFVMTACSSPADAGSSDDAAEAPAPCTPGATGAAGNPASLVGCVGGSLVDIRAYFFSVIGRVEGEPACDWEAVLQASGIPGGLGPGEQPPAN